MGEASAVDENDDGATIAAVTTENASEVTVDNEYFEVADGNLKLKDGMSLDFENVEGGMIELTLTASGDGESAEAMVTVTVNDVNEAPSIDVRDGVEVPGHDGVVSNLTIDENAMRGDAPPLALIEVMDPDAADADMLTGDAGMAATSVSDSRFAVNQDPEKGLWLHLAEGASLNYEDGAEVMVTVTYTDSAGNTASADITVMVADVNEGPVAVGEVPDVTALAGKDVEERINLLDIFSDPDQGDAHAVRYELSGAPDWLRFSVQFDEDEGGNDTAYGLFSGSPPTTGPNSDAAHMVTLTATDSGGEEGTTSFYVVVDDGNDRIESIDLYHNPDDNGNEARNVDYAVEVDENNDSGVVFGRITVVDPDHDKHPNGMHDVVISDSRFEIKKDMEGGLWLALKEGESLDFEEDGASLDITITATDGPRNRMGERTQNPTAQTVTVFINDKNDAPSPNEVGDWWVTVNRDLRPSEVTKGQLLSFEVESQADGDAKPAFTDQDVPRGGDALSYVISGVPWLEIDAESGLIQNKAGMMPQPGKYRVTLTAKDMGENRHEDEDTDGQSASVQFTVIVAESQPDDNGVLIAGNDNPTFTSDTTFAYTEGSGRTRVATFTVRDDDLNLDPHPFGRVEARITAAVNGIDATTDDTDYTAVLELSDPRPAGSNMVRYDIYARDNPRTEANELDLLNHEVVREITISLAVNDGIGVESDGSPTIDATRTGVRVRIEDRQEAPVFGTDADTSSTLQSDTRGTYVEVEQEGSETVTLYLNLSELWSDPEDDDLSGANRFTVTSNVDWAEVTVEPAEWRDVNTVRQQDGTTAPREWLTAADTDDPDTNDVVAIVVIDRTAAMGDNKQSDGGAITLTARDAARTGEGTIQIRVTDENLPIPDADDAAVDDPGVVSIRGVARQGSELRATFDHTKDPDLASGASPALVIYTWNSFAVDDDGAVTGSATLLQAGLSDRLMLTDAHAGRKIQVSVTYYEAFDDPGGTTHNFVAGNGGTAVTYTTPDVVRDRNDEGAVSFNLLTSGTVITANAVISDRDGVDSTADPTPPTPDDDDGTPPTYTWEESDNGRGGWTAVDADQPDTNKDNTADQTLDIASFYARSDADGKFLRVVVEYEDESGFSERHASDPIQVGALANPTTAQTASITGTLAVGGTLIVDSGGGSVQWQRQMDPTPSSPSSGDEYWANIPGATGNLQVTSDHQGATLRAVVTYTDADGNVTARVAVTEADTTGDGTANATAIAIPAATNSGPVPVDEYEIRAQVGEMTTHTVPLASLFQDADGDSLTFTVTGVTALGGDTVDDSSVGGSFYAYTGEEQIATFNTRTGMLTHRSDPDKVSGHDGTPDADGGGNIVTFTVTANDGTATSGAANVNLRINVAPTGISVNDAADSPTTGNEVTVAEIPASSPASRMPTIVARLNVQDQNESSDPFGTHTVTVDDDRFEVVQGTYNPATRTGERPDADGSTLLLVLKAGERLDFETDGRDLDPATDADTDGTANNDKQIELTLTATDGGGLSTPARPAIKVIVTISNVDSDDPPTPTPSDVPGLKDNEDSDDSDLTDGGTNGDADSDTDGGIPPPPGMSLGGIIEDFVDNMDGFEQDLLEDFLLKIDDGLDMV